MSPPLPRPFFCFCFLRAVCVRARGCSFVRAQIQMMKPTTEKAPPRTLARPEGRRVGRDREEKNIGNGEDFPGSYVPAPFAMDIGKAILRRGRSRLGPYLVLFPCFVSMACWRVGDRITELLRRARVNCQLLCCGGQGVRRWPWVARPLLLALGTGFANCQSAHFLSL